jgi:type IV pilus assembly protein PilB
MPTTTKTNEAFTSLLVQKNIITNEQLLDLSQKVTPEKSFDDLLLESRIVNTEDLMKFKSEALGVKQYIFEKDIPNDVMNIIPQKVAENYQMVAVNRHGRNLEVAMVDPNNFKAIEAAEYLAKDEGFHITYFIISQTDFNKAFKLYGQLKKEAEEVLEGVAPVISDLKKIKGDEDVKGVIKSAPVSKMVLVVIRHAIDGRASDIHIEPQVKETRIRYRVDGILYTTLVLPKYIHSAIVARIKVLANLKLDETRKPQDGRIRLNIDGRDIDFRISTLPLFEGEKVVMRVLDTKSQQYSLESLGFAKRHIEYIQTAMGKTHGTILVTGPTGSGKTTTLYTVLAMLNKEGVNIITLEDPIEYYIDGINQSQVNPEVGYTFAAGLRSILRQDPNVIMLGEIRDEETAELVVHASLTGHLVLTTLHTNSSVGAVPRLLDMGVESFLLAQTLNVIVAQRLARKICIHCKMEAKVPDDVRAEIEPEIEKIPEIYRKEYVTKRPFTFYRGKGCTKCGGKGYQGRTVVAEVLQITPEVQDAVAKGFHRDDAKKELERQNFITLRQDSLLKALSGATTLEEVFRVTQE